MSEVREKNETDKMSRRLSRRRKLLQVVGVALIAVAGLPLGLQGGSEPALHAAPAFFLTVGVLVLMSGLFLHQPGK
jgi:hypothetical protein